MADFGLDKVFCLNLQIVISQKPLGFRSEHFQSSHISMILTNGAKLEKFWEIMMSSSKKLDDLIWNCPGIF